MIDSYNELREEYYTALQGSITLNATTVNVYDVVKADEDTPFIYFADFDFKEDSCKDNFNGVATITLMVITKYTNAVGGSADSDNIGSQILKLLHNDTYFTSDNFRVVTNRLLDNSTDKVPTKTGTRIVKTIVLEHYLAQISGDLTRITDLAASDNGTTQIDLTWSRVTGNAGYRVEYTNNIDNGWSLLVTNATDTESYSHTGVTTDLIYYYRVRAFDSSGGSGWSNIVAERTQITGICSDATVENSNLSYTNTVGSGDTLVLPDIDITNILGTTTSYPSVIDIDLRVSPTNTVAPLVSGNAYQNQTLTTTNGTWITHATTTYTYQWKRDGVSIGGETNSTYLTTLTDIGTSITCEVTATNTVGATSSTSNGISVEFNPLSITDLKLYIPKNTALRSLSLDKSPNAFEFAQSTQAFKPIIATSYVNFNGTNGFQNAVGSDLLNHTSGYFFYNGYFDGTAQSFITSADSSIDTTYIIFGINSNGTIYIQVNIAANNRKIQSTNAVVSGSNFRCWFKWNNSGSPYVINLNGNTETNVVFTGTDDGKGFGHITGRDNLTLGSLQRLSAVYNSQSYNKILVSSSSSLSASELSAIDTFMSVTTNY
jgi:hypothetical protein